MQLEEEEAFYLKPMNCPHHHHGYAARRAATATCPCAWPSTATSTVTRRAGSWRAPAGSRHEHETMRTSMHADQVHAEFQAVIEMHKHYDNMFRLEDFCCGCRCTRRQGEVRQQRTRVAVRRNLGRQVLVDMQLRFEERTGEAAFYGPRSTTR